MSSYASCLKAVAARLEAAGVENASGDAFALLEKVSGLTRAAYYLRAGEDMPEAQVAELENLAARRAAREPLQHILGEWSFYGLTLRVGPQALIPRQETEVLVEEALWLIREKKSIPGDGRDAEDGEADGRGIPPIHVLDLCTGTGCIALAIAAHAPFAQITATDISPAALKLAQENAERLDLAKRIRFALGDGFAAVDPDERFDLICCNPPYIPRAEIAELAPEVREHDPLLALDGGADGLDFYRYLAQEAPAHLTAGGQLLLEIGKGQDADVCALLKEAGFEKIAILPDLAGISRVVRASRKE